jgi:hypothetical protein
MGILFALGAMIFWAIGDFFIQKTSRKIDGMIPIIKSPTIGQAKSLHSFLLKSSYTATEITFRFPKKIRLKVQSV